jgi:protein involved in polysaccharide export with SLBB domain
MTSYSNPRMQATIEDWPSGKRRVTAAFVIESDPRRGERAVRTTTGAPKKLTYAKKVRIVDGDDGRVYILELQPLSGFIHVMRGTMDYTYENISQRESPARHAYLMKLFDVKGEEEQ